MPTQFSETGGHKLKMYFRILEVFANKVSLSEPLNVL